jgi:hypothetical protein
MMTDFIFYGQEWELKVEWNRAEMRERAPGVRILCIFFECEMMILTFDQGTEAIRCDRPDRTTRACL